MALNLLVLSLLSFLSFSLLAQAVPDPMEIALRHAINSSRSTTFFLTKDIYLSADLPPLPNNKVLVVTSANIPGAPFRIDGQNKYRLFNGFRMIKTTLKLTNIILSSGKSSVVDMDSDSSTVLTVERVRFLNNEGGIKLVSVRASVSNSEFFAQRSGAIKINWNTTLTLSKCKLWNNQNRNSVSLGGAVEAFRATLIADECTFERNLAGYGGAVTLYLSSTGAFRKCTFLYNRAANTGGAIWSFNSDISVKDSNFLYNTATSREGGAASISAQPYVIDRPVKRLSGPQFAYAYFSNVTFQRNVAANGGAFSLQGNGSSAIFCKSSFWRNNGASASLNNGYLTGGKNIVIGTITGAAVPLVSVAPGATVKYTKVPCTPL